MLKQKLHFLHFNSRKSQQASGLRDGKQCDFLSPLVLIELKVSSGQTFNQPTRPVMFAKQKPSKTR